MRCSCMRPWLQSIRSAPMFQKCCNEALHTTKCQIVCGEPLAAASPMWGQLAKFDARTARASACLRLPLGPLPSPATWLSSPGCPTSIPAVLSPPGGPRRPRLCGRHTRASGHARSSGGRRKGIVAGV